jgi:predicted DCC family thiol-disulfide oxidoreductase YuxK
MSRPGLTQDDLWVVYDGECPFCSSYVRLYRLREVTGRVHLIDAREPHAIVGEVRALGFDLDDGMAVKAAGRFYHGAEAMQILAILGSGSGLFNALNRALFRRPRLARALYPWMVRGRLLTLRLLGRRTLHSGRGGA